MISTTKKLKSTLLGLVVIMFVPSISAHAYDINMPGFTGTVNTTVTSGFSVRSSDRDGCYKMDTHITLLDQIVCTRSRYVSS